MLGIHPETLVKFCSADTAWKILENQSLRWSAPYLFSDPFELSHESQLSFDPHALLMAAIKQASSMIFARETPRGNNALTIAIRRWREEERFDSPDEAQEVLKELLSQVVNQRQPVLDQIMTDWRKFSRNLRICCFSAKPDNLSCWQHFADSHRGVAIRFRCGEESSLHHPVHVSYKNYRPEITTLQEQLSVIMNNERFVAQENFEEKFSIKPNLYSAEQEWRCFHKVREELNTTVNNEVVWYNDLSFGDGEITALYLGMSTPPEMKRKLYDLAKEKYSQAKIFQTKAVSGKYQLEFERLKS